MSETIKGIDSKGDRHLLITDEAQEAKYLESESEFSIEPKGTNIFTPPVVVTLAVIVLSAIGLGIIYSSDELSEQFQAMLAGELGKYKEERRKAREDKIREIEMLTTNKYGSLVLFYSPRDAYVNITEKKFKLDCTSEAEKGEDAHLACLRRKFDYTQRPEERQIDNPSLHLDRSNPQKKQVVEQIPLNDIPIQETSDDRKILYRYEYEIKIHRDGYYPRVFYLTGDKERPPIKDVEPLLWEQRGPGVFMADFRGADLLPKPETAKENYVKARIALICEVDKEVEAKRKAGKRITDEQVQGYYLEIINRHGFKTFDEWNRINSELMKDQAFVKDLEAQLKKVTCK